MAVTLGAVLFVIAGFSRSWSELGGYLKLIAATLFYTTLGNVIGHRTVGNLLDREYERQDAADKPKPSGLADRMEATATAIEMLNAQVAAAGGEWSPEHEHALGLLMDDVRVLQQEERQLRQQARKKSQAAVAGGVLALIVTGIVWLDYSRVQHGEPAQLLPMSMQTESLEDLLVGTVLVSFVAGTSMILLVIERQYRSIFLWTLLACIVIVVPVGWSISLNTPNMSFWGTQVFGVVFLLGASLFVDLDKGKKVSSNEYGILSGNNADTNDTFSSSHHRIG